MTDGQGCLFVPLSASEFCMSGVLYAIGAIAVVIILMGLIGFALMKKKGGRLINTPFVKTGDLAAKGDAVCGEKNAVSTEGAFIRPAAMLTSPVDGKECLMYRLSVTASWKVGEKQHKVTMMEEKKSINFQIDDGSGPITIDPGTTGDFEPLHRFSQSKGKGLKSAFTGGGIKFGATEFEVHPGGRYKGKLVPDNAKIHVEEKALEPQAMFYANGKWENNTIQKHSWSSLILSNQSRDETLASTLKTEKNSKRAILIGGILAPLCFGIGFLLAPSPDGGTTEKAATVQTDDGAKSTKKEAPAKTGSSKKSSDAGKTTPKAESAPAGGKGKSGGGKKGKKKGGKGKRR
jgi:hypothetical protein